MLTKQITVTAGAAAANAPLNRYRDILPCEATRVVLATPSQNNNPACDYINANLMALPLVAPAQRLVFTQGPLDSTAPAFWQMIVQQRSPTVVMVTDCVEGGRAKCAQYWPQSPGASLQCGAYTIHNRSSTPHDSFMVSRLQVSLEGTGPVSCP